MLKKYKIILAIIVILLLLCICKEVNAAGVNLCRLKSTTQARNSDGTVQFVLPKDTVVDFIQYHKNKKYALCEYKVNYVGKKYRKKGYIAVKKLQSDKAADYKYVDIETFCVLKYESAVKDSNGKIQFILPADTVVKYIKQHSSNKKYALCEYKVNYMGDKYVKRGYILVNSLKADKKLTACNYFKINNQSEINVIKNKIQIIRYADYINNLGVKYSDNIINRVAFYEKYEKLNKPKTDCASLCATIYNRVLGIDFYRDSKEINIWTVPFFVDNAENRFCYADTKSKGTRFFYKVKEINNGKGSISLDTMQIGDSVVIGKSYSRDKNGKNIEFDHIYMYIGDGVLIESIYYDGGNDKEYKKVVKRDVPKYFYTAQRGDGNGQWHYIIQIRPLYKYMSR